MDDQGQPGSQAAPETSPPSFVKEAFRWQYNVIVLAAAVFFALVSTSVLPLVLAAGLELIYLSTVPNMARFQRLVRSWKYEQEKRDRETKLADMLAELPRELFSRYQNLCEVCASIRANYRRLSSASQIFVGQIDQKLNGLAHSYLRLLYASKQYREYLRLVDPGAIRREVAELEHGLAGDPEKVQEINRKRIEILNKRVEKYQKVAENLSVVDAQCAAIEDVLHLMRDQSVTLRDPQQLSDQLQSLVQDVEQTEQTVREVEEIFQMAAPEEMESSGLPGELPVGAGERLPPPPLPSQQETRRQRARN